MVTLGIRPRDGIPSPAATRRRAAEVWTMLEAQAPEARRLAADAARLRAQGYGRRRGKVWLWIGPGGLLDRLLSILPKDWGAELEGLCRLFLWELLTRAPRETNNAR